jgi:hypothetical protein
MLGRQMLRMQRYGRLPTVGHERSCAPSSTEIREATEKNSLARVTNVTWSALNNITQSRSTFLEVVRDFRRCQSCLLEQKQRQASKKNRALPPGDQQSNTSQYTTPIKQHCMAHEVASMSQTGFQMDGDHGHSPSLESGVLAQESDPTRQVESTLHTLA